MAEGSNKKEHNPIQKCNSDCFGLFVGGGGSGGATPSGSHKLAVTIPCDYSVPTNTQ